MFDFKSETEDLDDLADEIFEALYKHTSSQRNEIETDTSQTDINNPWCWKNYGVHRKSI